MSFQCILPIQEGITYLVGKRLLRNGNNMPLKSNGVAFLTVTCTNTNCRATYRAYRRVDPPWPSNSSSPPPVQINYCMFCAEPNPYVSQESNEQDWIDSMAEQYNKSPDEVRQLLAIYESAPPEAKLTWEKLMGVKS